MVNRPDQRTDNTQIRAFSASQNILNRADGSSKFEFGSTSVICSVSGPMDIQIRDEKLDEATVDIVIRPAKGVPATKEKLMETILRTAFEPIILAGMMPRTLIQVVVQILKDDGCLLAASVNAITLALLDAGIPMKQMAGAITVMIDEKTNDLVLDPTLAELENAKSTHTFAFDNVHEKPFVLLSDSDGVFSEEEYFSCHDLAFEAVEKIHGFLRLAVESKKEKEQQQLNEH
ncbi:ribosomal protein S5 domain 2-type protein [Cokeromyces recurvatus]|uniref:ribosomal protein S5 domain 2-type protein n=1 Tax=Cokeromyces recurvatus TaxID=90255 RepID=UPI00221E9B24|nr:ribosomal protein S5 domain 2-type protein [Cokeromyces recurvatus]KAI7903374.1 ribosomal protein S5 domain 2-type protein [Cokeromyces recurvatus]